MSENKMDARVDRVGEILKENGWKVTEKEYSGMPTLKAEMKYARLSITMETCSCHGGRMMINEEHSKMHYRIEHESYDESLGITDPWTELDFIIENEMMEQVNKFSTFIYKLTKINEYGKAPSGLDEIKETYYSDIEYLTREIIGWRDIGDKITDYNQIDKYEKIYPNKLMYGTVERINVEPEYSWEENRIWFENTEYRRKHEDSEFKPTGSYRMFVSIFKKR